MLRNIFQRDNNTFSKSIIDSILDQDKTLGNQKAFIFLKNGKADKNSKAITYRELLNRIKSIATYIQKKLSSK